MALLTLLDIVKRNGRDMEVGLVDETTRAHPEISGQIVIPGGTRPLPGVGAARTIRGTSYKTLVRTALPSVGFRRANQGTARTKSRYEERTVETYIMNPRWGVDKAVAARSEDGWQALLADEAEAHVEASWQTVAKQFYYGPDNGGDSLGFPGLLDSYDSTNMVIDAGGTTADTGSSVWFVKFGPKSVQWVYGQNGQFETSEVDERDMTDADSNNYTGYHQELHAYPGLQVTSNQYVVRIKKLTEDSGKGLTDDLVAKALEKFRVGIVPDVMFMTKRSRRQLQLSRTATNATGAPAPIPEESHNIPIAVTEALLDTEALTL